MNFLWEHNYFIIKDMKLLQNIFLYFIFIFLLFNEDNLIIFRICPILPTFNYINMQSS